MSYSGKYSLTCAGLFAIIADLNTAIDVVFGESNT